MTTNKTVTDKKQKLLKWDMILMYLVLLKVIF